MKCFRPAKKQHAELNITPLIDIIFILLVFFMVSSTFLKPVIKIKLPVAATSEKEKREKINLFVGKNLTIYIDKKQMKLAEMQAVIAKEIVKNPELAVLFYADRSLSFENVMNIMDALKMAGVKNVAISHNSEK